MTAIKLFASASILALVAALSPVQAATSSDGCVTEDGNVLTCTCNCDSLKQACENGHAKWDPDAHTCTVGSTRAILGSFEATVKSDLDGCALLKAAMSRLCPRR
jgi:hypothetical protein